MSIILHDAPHFVQLFMNDSSFICPYDQIGVGAFEHALKCGVSAWWMAG